MKDRIPENETSIPFTVYGSSTSFLPLRRQDLESAGGSPSAAPTPISTHDSTSGQCSPCPLTALPSARCCSLDLGHWKSTSRRERQRTMNASCKTRSTHSSSNQSEEKQSAFTFIIVHVQRNKHVSNKQPMHKQRHKQLIFSLC